MPSVAAVVGGTAFVCSVGALGFGFGKEIGLPYFDWVLMVTFLLAGAIAVLIQYVKPGFFLSLYMSLHSQ